MNITYRQLKNELMLTSYITADEANFAMDKSSVLYQALKYWGSKYKVNLKNCWNVTKETFDYIWIKLPLPMNKQQFSHFILNDTVSTKWHDYATDKFIKYVNHRKTLFNIHMFRVFHSLTPDMQIPYKANHIFYTQLRLHGIMENMENGWLKIDYNHLPMSMTNKFGKAPDNKGEVLYRLAFEFPYLFISKNSLMWYWIKLWYKKHNKDMSKDICGLQISKHYIYIGMSDIVEKPQIQVKNNSHKKRPRHPQEYSGIDYYVFQGDSSGIKARKFIHWVRNILGLPVTRQKNKAKQKN